MHALKLVGGFAIFIPLFVLFMWLPSTLTSRNRTGLAWLAWIGGLALLFLIINIYAGVVR